MLNFAKSARHIYVKYNLQICFCQIGKSEGQGVLGNKNRISSNLNLINQTHFAPPLWQLKYLIVS